MPFRAEKKTKYMRLYMRQSRAKRRARRVQDQLAVVQQDRQELISQMADLAVQKHAVVEPDYFAPTPAPRPEPPRTEPSRPSGPTINEQSTPCLIDFSKPENQWRGPGWRAKGFEDRFRFDEDT